jgi:hypothetical protein
LGAPASDLRKRTAGSGHRAAIGVRTASAGRPRSALSQLPAQPGGTTGGPATEVPVSPRRGNTLRRRRDDRGRR